LTILPLAGNVVLVRESKDKARRQKMTNAGVILNQTITHLTDYVGHWRGEAYQTHHTYGVQIHRTRAEAERWNDQQRALRPSAG
jgi:hypothetical protein